MVGVLIHLTELNLLHLVAKKNRLSLCIDSFTKNFLFGITLVTRESTQTNDGNLIHNQIFLNQFAYL